jgi:hypothetical protein
MDTISKLVIADRTDKKMLTKRARRPRRRRQILFRSQIVIADRADKKIVTTNG